MQFVKNGPDVPEILLHTHEKGRVVFFCGAGISYLAGLPGFKGLVDDIYRIVATKPDPDEEAAYNRGQYDVTLAAPKLKSDPRFRRLVNHYRQHGI